MVKVKTNDLKKAVEQSLVSGDYSKVTLITNGNVLKVGSVNYEFHDEKYIDESRHYVYENYLSISIDVIEKNNDLIVLVFRDDLLNILNSVKSEYINLFLQEEKYKYFLIINDGKTNHRLRSQDPDQVKYFADKRLVQDIENGIKIKTKDLIDAIDKVIYATYEGEYFLIRKTIGLIFEDNTLFIAGTGDNHTAVYNLKVKNRFRSKKYGIVELTGRFGITKTCLLYTSPSPRD